MTAGRCLLKDVDAIKSEAAGQEELWEWQFTADCAVLIQESQSTIMFQQQLVGAYSRM
jgi:hypothetical protein